MNYSGIILIVVMVALMYFLMIRPQQRQRKQQQDMVSRMKKGDQVITIGRLHGTIDEVNNENKTVVLDCEGIYLTFDIAAIATVLPDKTEKVAAPASTDTDDAADSQDSAESETVSEAPASEAAPAEEEPDSETK